MSSNINIGKGSSQKLRTLLNCGWLTLFNYHKIVYFFHTISLDDPFQPLDLYNDFTNLQIFMINFQHICDVEWTMFSTTCLLQHLCIDVACGGHQDHVAAQFCCHKRGISNLSTWEQKKILRTKSIRPKVVDL